MKSLIQSAFLLLALLLPAIAAAYDFEVDGIYYNINGNEAAVTSSPSNNRYRGDVTIPEAVTYNGTTYSVTVIGERAFENCSSLKSVSIPNSVITIERIALWGCRGLTSIIVPYSVTTIGDRAFYGCSNLTNMTVDIDNPKYDSRNDCNAIIETSSNTLMVGCKSTVIPNTVTSIGSGAFEGCNSLTSITIPSSVTAIGNSAFGYCYSLTNVNIPNSVASIGAYAFDNCSGLKNMTVESGNPSYDSRNNCNAIIETASNTLIAGCKSTVIPNSVTSIDECAFRGCSGLTIIDIPNSVRFIGRDAFHGCRNLKSVTFGNSLSTIDYYAFEYCSSLTSVTIPNSVTFIGQGVFRSCDSLSRIIVESGNRTYDSRDNCNAIIETSSNTLLIGCMNTVIPNTITSIASSAFSGSTGMTSVTIPNSVYYIGYGAFFDCNHLSEVYSYIADPSVIYMSDMVFYQNPGGSDYSYRTLYVPYGTAAAYQADRRWSDYFGSIVEMDRVPLDLPGDVNADEDVNITDINIVVDIILGATLDDETMKRADVNGDGSINISDVNAIINIIVGGGEEPAFEPEWVDLGLESGTLWATCNVGATKPEEYGDLFAWGETEPKYFYAFENYKWCDGTDDTLTKYCSADGKRELDPEDDAAYVNWGPSWRMPTASQQSELMLNCIWQWTQQNGVNGYLVKGTNGKSIFLPAAGEGFYSRIHDVGSEGSYWSREGVTLANGIGFNSEEKFWIAGARAYGRSVRAVRVP